MTKNGRSSLGVTRLMVVTLAGSVLAGCACPAFMPAEPIAPPEPVEVTPPPKPDPPPPLPPPKPPSMELVIHFDYDMAAIRAGDMSVLDRHARFLAENSDWRVRIEGHCDDRGSERYNLELGERRAQAVRQIFLDMGIADSRMDVISFGEERPAAEGYSDEARAQNRRAVIIHLSR